MTGKPHAIRTADNLRRWHLDKVVSLQRRHGFLIMILFPLMFQGILFGTPHFKASSIIVESGEEDPEDRDSLNRHAKQILQRGRYQRKIEEEKPLEINIESKENKISSSPLIGNGVLYVMLIAFVVLVAVILTSRTLEYRAFRRSQAHEIKKDGLKNEGLDEASSLSRAQRLARDGRFDEAVHVLLLTATDILAARRNLLISNERTSRELLRELPINEDERSRFRHLVQAVELSLFGGRPVTEADYISCDEAYRGIEA